jgi:hypothetical protein
MCHVRKFKIFFFLSKNLTFPPPAGLHSHLTFPPFLPSFSSLPPILSLSPALAKSLTLPCTFFFSPSPPVIQQLRRPTTSLPPATASSVYRRHVSPSLFGCSFSFGLVVHIEVYWNLGFGNSFPNSAPSVLYL